MTDWMALVMKIKHAKKCSLKEAMQQAKKIYKK
jgi:hypothetical protein